MLFQFSFSLTTQQNSKRLYVISHKIKQRNEMIAPYFLIVSEKNIKELLKWGCFEEHRSSFRCPPSRKGGMTIYDENP